MMWGWGDYGTGSWLGMGLMMFFGLLLLVGFVMLVVWAVNSSQRHAGAGGRGPAGTWTHQGPGGLGGDDAWEFARQRYARGEITEEELNRIRENLRR